MDNVQKEPDIEVLLAISTFIMQYDNVSDDGIALGFVAQST